MYPRLHRRKEGRRERWRRGVAFEPESKLPPGSGIFCIALNSTLLQFSAVLLILTHSFSTVRFTYLRHIHLPRPAPCYSHSIGQFRCWIGRWVGRVMSRDSIRRYTSLIDHGSDCDGCLGGSEMLSPPPMPRNGDVNLSAGRVPRFCIK